MPPSTSSPMIRHAAVWIVLAKFCCAVEAAIVPATELTPVNETGVWEVDSAADLDKGRAIRANRENMKIVSGRHSRKFHL